MPPSRKRSKKVFKPLAIAAIMAGSLLQPFMLPAFAAAGDQISNTATATYEDADGNDFETESNTVVVTVKEIAGLVVEGIGVDDPNGGSFEDGDTLNFKYTVENVGNDTTDILLPATGDIVTQNFVITEVIVYLSDGTTEVGRYNTTPTTQQSVKGLDAGNQLPANGLAAGENLIVHVVGTVDGDGLNPGDDITVTLGDTGDNELDDASTDNQPLDNTTNPERNVRTDDLDSETSTELAVADEKESSGYNKVDFATEQTPLALAKVKKTHLPADPGETGSADDDIITYALEMEVESETPSAEYLAGELAATPIQLDTGGGAVSADRIIISDVVPEFTEFDSTILPRTPAGGDWTVVYSTDDPSATIAVEANGGTAATWTTTKPADNLIRRVGFIYDPVASGNILPGESYTGFEFDVITNGLPAAGGTIYNIAQVFGTTYDDPANPNDPVDQIIYDESGDDNPNNFEGLTPPAETDGGTPDGSDFDPANDTGEADPNNHGTDDGNDNSVENNPDGEDNVIVLTGEEQSGNDNILNGPDGSADAVGPTDDDDDYTNMGINPGNLGDTDATNNDVEFINTVANPATNTSQIDNVTVVPINPGTALFNDDENPDGSTAKYGDPTLIPNGTTVTISYDVDGDGTIETAAEDEVAVYTWNGTNWTTSDTPINIGTLQPGEQADYNVAVEFPEAVLAEGTVIDIPLIAFPDTGLDGYNGTDATAGETVNNITIDRIYVGFMTLTKEARILDTDGITVLEDWTESPVVEAESGQYIEYRITYENVSPSAVGSGNVSLTAENFQVIEDGDTLDDLLAGGGAAGTNNWHSDQAGEAPLTQHARGVVQSAGTVEYFREYTERDNTESAANGSGTAEDSIGTVDPATGALVEAYVNTVGQVAPQNGGSLIFRRQVN